MGLGVFVKSLDKVRMGAVGRRQRRPERQAFKPTAGRAPGAESLARRAIRWAQRPLLNAGRSRRRIPDGRRRWGVRLNAGRAASPASGPERQWLTRTRFGG